MNLIPNISSHKPLVTIAVPSFNQGQFLDDALSSIFTQKVPAQVFVLDGGSSDNSINVIKKWERHLAGWRSYKDNGQASAINEGIAMGQAPFVFWLNSDDWLLPNAISTLINTLDLNPEAPVIYGKSWNIRHKTGKRSSVWVEPFDKKRLALRCIISQPATIIRRSAWEALGGLDPNLHMAMDYDLWWRIYINIGIPKFIDRYIAVNRIHKDTKTNTQRRRHYYEAIKVVRKHYGSVPLKWWLAKPYAVWFKSVWPF